MALDKRQNWERWMDRMGYRSSKCSPRDLNLAKRLHSDYDQNPGIVQVHSFVRLTWPADRICGAVFTSLPSALQICLNGEPILSLQPDVSDPSTHSNAQALREERYIIRRMRHSVGEVTCLSIEEHVSLPADAQLTMRFHSSAPAQAFFSIKKL